MKLVSLCFAVSCAASALAQEPPLVAPSTPAAAPDRLSRPAVVPIHTAPDDPGGGEYGTWAAGSGYKVSFHGEPTVVPYLGKDYPRNQPWSWSTRSITLGERVLADHRGPVERRRFDTRYEYGRGPIVEAYDVLEAGVEQTFVLAEHPGTPGDLVIRGEVRSDLRPLRQFRDEHRAIVYVDDRGEEILSYGQAFAIDASGRTERMKTSVEGSRITLRVSAKFLDDATFPVTVDPLVGPRTIGATQTYNLDIARNDRDDRILYAWISYSSAADRDAYAYSYDNGLTSGSLVFADVTTGWSTPEVAACHVGTSTTNKWLVVMQRDFSTQTGIRVWVWDARLTTASYTVLYLQTLIGQHDWWPDCGGVEAYNQSGFASSGDRGMIVWQRDVSLSGSRHTRSTKIFAMPVDCRPPSGVLGSEVMVSFNGSHYDAQYPSINKVSAGADGSDPTRWMVAYQELDSRRTNANWRIFARSLTSGGLATFRWHSTDGIGENRITPKIEGQRGRYLVCYGQQSFARHTNQLDADTIEVERFDYASNGAITNFPQTRIGTRTGTSGDLIARDVAYDADTDSHWLAAWSAANIGMAFSQIGFEGKRIFGQWSTGSTTADAWDGAVVYDDDTNRFVCGHTWFFSNIGIRAVFYEYPPEPGTPLMTGAGCSPAVLSWRGRDAQGNLVSANDQQVGNEFGTCDVSGMPAGALSILLVGTNYTNSWVLHPAVPRSCLLLVDNFNSMPAQIGSTSSHRIPLPSWLSGGGTRIFFQCWHLNASGTQLLSTRRLEVPLYR